MENKYRLSSNAFNREDDNDKISPKKIYYISVEGNVTEKEYFNGISINRQKIGIDAIIDVHVLGRRRNDTRCMPSDVLELLEEYVELRDNEEDNFFENVPEEIIKKWGKEFIKEFLDENESGKAQNNEEFRTDLLKLGYDISYRKYLRDHANHNDEFGIVIDRDQYTHSEFNMLNCIDYCKKKNYSCYISNPCFEFWLLLHHVDVKNKYANQMNLILENKKISNKHTFVSNEISRIVHHAKGHILFEKNYLPFIDDAINRAKEFESDEIGLVDNVGSNIWKLIEKMRKSNKE
ncbi:RloB-like protein [Eubacterium uniforme]|uniref:RloB-like protein n=1 Tax=Eubacterium uniforme TaxID=39495 RepID=A0A1T4VKB6_9FIRM|nr:RloB family protein [Eubacterium uniforme]SKA65389.1 RloB-like protein [Eubacterium uniforme]